MSLITEMQKYTTWLISQKVIKPVEGVGTLPLLYETQAPPLTTDELWSIIQRALMGMKNARARDGARGVLMRRLRHNEMGAEPQAQKGVHPKQGGPAVWVSPPCVCGAALNAHDPMTGECVNTGCDMFTKAP